MKTALISNMIFFAKTYMKHYDSAYPTIKNRVRRKNERLKSKPWILPWLEDAIARKQNLYFESVTNPSVRITYKKLQKFCDKHVDIAKKKYYKKFFDDHKDNSKKQWQMINNLLNRNSKKSGTIKLFDDTKNKQLSSPIDVASHFNTYFTSIASNLKAQNTRLVFDPGGFEQFLDGPCQNSMFLRPVNSNEVHDVIKSFKNKSTLDSKISALKVASECNTFTDVLAMMINNSFEFGIFPEPLKTARVVPIYKEGSKTEVSNYRPISLLSSFSKIYEKTMHGRLLEHLERNDSLFELQYGFRPGRSCEHALLNAQNTILNSLNKKQVALLLLIDFSKAFDMVDHETLLSKLYHYGIRGTVHKWFKSYLTDRKQFVTIDGTDSPLLGLGYGVPQGSILGPLLFIIYINDLPGISKLAKFILYADDANIIISGPTVEDVYEKLNSLAKKLIKWVETNGLALNVKKTKYMIFSRQRTSSEYEFKLANVKIERKAEVRFLGVIVDDNLTWSKHITTVKTKMSRYFGIMYKIRRHIPIDTRLQIFHSLVQSHLKFCSLVWGFAAQSHIDSVFRKQKSGIRAVMSGYVQFKYRDGQIPTHTKSTFHSLNVLTIHSIIVKNALIFMHKARNFPSSLPVSVRTTIPTNAPSTADCNHENSSEWLQNYQFGCPHYRRSLFFKGPLLSIRTEYLNIVSPACLLSLNVHKKSVKKLMLDLQNQGEPEEWPPFILNNINGLRKCGRLQN